MDGTEDQYSDLELDFAGCDDFNLLDTDSSLCSQGLKSHGEEVDEEQFLPGSEEYKKARKRRQNRESAARNRARKKMDYYQLEREIEKLSQENRRLMLENQSLRTENEILKKELSFYLSVIEKPAATSKSPSPSLLTTAVIATLLCVCVLLGDSSPQVSMSRAEGGRGLLSIAEATGSYLPAVALIILWAAVAWKSWTASDSNPHTSV